MGYLGLFLNIIGLFLPWLNMFYYYDYYYPWEFIGLFGIGIFSVIGSFLAFFGLFRKSRTLLATAGLFNIYNAGGVIAFLMFCFLPEVIGIGAIICLIAGLILLVVAFLPMDIHNQAKNHGWNQNPTFNNTIGNNNIEKNFSSLIQSNECPYSFPLVRYCKYCGKQLH